MRIDQIAPHNEGVPPRFYGGTERVVSYLTEELVRQGHDVTLFASGDSKTSAKLVRCREVALRLNPAVRDSLPYHMITLDEVRRRIDEFDVLHFHIDVLHAPLMREVADRTLTTLPWPVGLAGPGALLRYLRTLPARLDLDTSAGISEQCELAGYRRGSVPEIIRENISGFVVDTIDEAVAAVREAANLDCVKVRVGFERRFTAEQMACGYVDIYRQLLFARIRPTPVRRANGRHTASETTLPSLAIHPLGQKRALHGRWLRLQPNEMVRRHIRE